MAASVRVSSIPSVGLLSVMLEWWCGRTEQPDPLAPAIWTAAAASYLTCSALSGTPASASQARPMSSGFQHPGPLSPTRHRGARARASVVDRPLVTSAGPGRDMLCVWTPGIFWRFIEDARARVLVLDARRSLPCCRQAFAFFPRNRFGAACLVGSDGAFVTGIACGPAAYLINGGARTMVRVLPCWLIAQAGRCFERRVSDRARS